MTTDELKQYSEDRKAEQLKATLFISPTGTQCEIVITNVSVEDKEWFLRNHIELSMEELSTGDPVIYGRFDNDDNEALEIGLGRDCIDVLHSLRKQIEVQLNNYVLLFTKEGISTYHEFMAYDNQRALHITNKVMERLLPVEDWKLLKTQKVCSPE